MRRRRHATTGIWIIRLDALPDETADQIGDPDQPNTGGHREQSPGHGLGHLVSEPDPPTFLRRFTQSLRTRKRFVADALVDQRQAVAELRQLVKSR